MSRRIHLIFLTLLVLSCGLFPQDNRRWYVSVEGESQGPYTTKQVREMALSPEDYVLLEGTTQWVEAGTVEGLLPPKKNPVKAKSTANDQPIFVINASNRGERTDIERFVVPGKTTIFDFYSDYCPPCRAVAPKLERLANSRNDIVVRKVDINRPGHQGIDWRSPVAQQYGLRFVPYYVVYNPDRSVRARGQEAAKLVYSWLN